ncbi:MAG: hypothetical protein PGN08_14840 [Sphingomonas taxi]
MSGPVKAAIIIALAVVVLVALNVRMYRAMKAATAKGRVAEAERD